MGLSTTWRLTAHDYFLKRQPNVIIMDVSRGSVNRGALRVIFTAVFRLPQAGRG